MSRLYLSYANSLFVSIESHADYYIMSDKSWDAKLGAADAPDMSEGVWITYYKLPKKQDYLAKVRYTAFAKDRKPISVYEGVYEDTPEEFCRLERDLELALESGIETTILSSYEQDLFPVISEYLQ